MKDNQHNPSYIPQIGIPEKKNFQERTYTRAIYHKATAPGFFGVIIICFFMSFINIKCSGHLLASYSGIDIVTGVDKSKNKNGKEASSFIPVTQSAYYQLEKAKEKMRSNIDIKKIEDEKIDEVEDDYTTTNGFDDMSNTRFENTTTNTALTRLFTFLALICAIAGFVLSFLKRKWGTFFQIITGLLGFVFLMLLQIYIKATIPIAENNDTAFHNEYTVPMVTTEFALGYWMALMLFLSIAIIGILKVKNLKGSSKNDVGLY